jgi:hypothetical protein
MFHNIPTLQQKKLWKNIQPPQQKKLWKPLPFCMRRTKLHDLPLKEKQGLP